MKDEIKYKNVVDPQIAESELVALLEEMSIDTDVDLMTEDDAKEFKDIVRTLTIPMIKGKAYVDGSSYILNLKKPLDKDGVEKTISISEPSGLAWELIDRAKKGEDIKKLLRFAEGFTGVPYAQIRSMPNSDLKILRVFAQLFLA